MWEMLMELGICGQSENLRRVIEENARKVLLHVEDVLQLGQEPLVDLRHLPDLVDRIPTMERRRNRKNPLIRRIDELLINILHIIVLYPHQPHQLTKNL